jgi:hypothetical protein
MALARTGHKEQEQPNPPTPTDPPQPPPPQYNVLGTVRLSTNLFGSSPTHDIPIYPPGARISIDGYEYYYWTTDFHPILPDGTKKVRISAFTEIRNLRGNSGMDHGNSLECTVPYKYGANIKRIVATQIKGNFPTYNLVCTQLTFHDINGKFIVAGGILVFDMSHIFNIANGFYKRRVLFDVTCLG